MIRSLALLCCLAGLAPAFAADEAGTRTIILVRHGEYDADPAADPKLGPHLSALGVAQAQLVGARLAGLPGGISGLHVSPMQRARDTAAAIGQALPGQRFDTIADLAECTPPTRRSKVMSQEDPKELAACQAQLDRLFEAWFKPASGAARSDLFVCHGNVIRYLVTRALGVDSKAWLEMSIGHASVTKVRVLADGSMQVLSVGDVGHLPPNLQSGTSADPERSLEIPSLR
jgi:serine/threonine-protein phosphatase PGAM5